MSLTAWLLLAAMLTTARMVLTAGWPLVLPLLLLAQMTHAITFAAHHTVCMALISHHFPGQLRGRGQALYTVIGYGIPGVLGGLGGGALSSWLGLPAVFWMGAAMGVLASAAAYKVWRLQHLH